jgi:hypothetical protein
MNSSERREARYRRRREKRRATLRASIGRYDNFDLLTDPENLYRAYRRAKLGVSWKESVQRYASLWLLNINKTVRKLNAGEKISNGFVEFDIKERGKNRHIKSIHISERVVQKCLCDQVLVPMLSRTLVYDNGASLKNKGTHFALRRFIVHMARFYRKNNFSNKGYALIIDFSRFFDSIRHDVLLNKLSKYIEDKRLFDLVSGFITVFGDNISLGLGSQISQAGAVFYPSKEVDHFIKEKLGIKYYGRYMDDLYLIHHDKDYLKYCLQNIITQCESIGITVNTKKTRIVPLKRGIVFLKGRYSLNENGRVIRLPCRPSTVRMRRKLKKFRRLVDEGRMNYRDVYLAYQSWRNGYMKRFNAYYRVRKMDGYYCRLFIRSQEACYG